MALGPRVRLWLGRLAAVAVVAVTLAVPAAGGRAQEHALVLPAVVRVLLSGVGEHIRIELRGPAEATVDGARVELGASQRIVVSPSARFLAFAAPQSASWADGVGVAGPARALLPTQVHVGPYVELTASERHRRLLRAETGVAARLLPPRATLAVGAWAAYELPTALLVQPQDPREQALLNGMPYRGALHIQRDDSGFSVVNHVVLADYLASVVGAEMPSSWELEALKAQAVAARTYAMQRLQPDSPYDLCDNQNCQAYNGVRSESERTRAAVAETAGVVALFEGAPIDALYSANAGDVTEDSENVWGTTVPYLRSVASPEDAQALSVSWGAAGYRWTRVILLPDLAEYRVLRNGGIGAVVDLRVLESTPSGRPLRLLVVGTAGDVELFGDEVRTALGLPSAFVEVELAPPSSVTLIDPTPLRLNALVSEGHEIASIRRSVAFQAAPADVELVNGAVRIAVFERPGSLVVNGRGFGHGLGMSQWGAQGMALAGSTFDEILGHYYTGIELRALS